MTPDLEIQDLPDSEEKVMLALWRCGGEASFYQIQLALEGERWAPSTLLNFLYRLEEKGWVKSGKQGNCNTYTPLITRRAYCVWSMRQRLDLLFEGDLAAAVQALVSESGCGQSELEQAIKVLEEKHLEAEEYDLYDPYG